MSDDNYHKDRIANRRLHPETLMMGYGYSPAMSEGALKPPVFLTSTFVFENAQQGKDFFDLTAGRRQLKPGEKSGLVYSRFNHPNMEILEDRLAIWDEAEACAVFASGMAAIATTCFAFLRPGDTIVHSRPLYGGTETLLKNQMGAFGVTPFGFTDGVDVVQMRKVAQAAAAKGRVAMILVETPALAAAACATLRICATSTPSVKPKGVTPKAPIWFFSDGVDVAQMRKVAQAAAAKGRVAMILVETPANPTNGLVDLSACKAIADELEKSQGHRPPVVVDNTMLGPIFQKPLKHGADLTLLSLTKYVGGHSDLVGGSISGAKELVRQVKGWRGSLGTQLDPNSCWMLMRSLETLDIRMQRANENGRKVAEYLRRHPKIAKVHYLGDLAEGDPRKPVFDRQCTQPGSTFAFDVKGGEREAFAVLDNLQIMKLAVSLGGTETLVSHPAAMTHSGVARELREEIGLTDALIRISVGIENIEDLISDLAQALDAA